MRENYKKLALWALIAATAPLRALAVTIDVSGYPIAAIILSPLILGFLMLAGASLIDSEEHPILRIFLVLFAFMTYFLTAWMGVQTIVNYYTFDALQDSLTTSVWVFGGAMVVILCYFLIYAFWKASETAAQNDRERRLK